MKLLRVAAVALCLLGCAPSGDPVELLTGEVLSKGSCYTSAADGLLLFDPKYGTAIADSHAGGTTSPVMWRPGFTGRRVGSEVVVLDPLGNVVATTGRTYRLEGGYWYETPYPFFACGYVNPE